MKNLYSILFVLMTFSASIGVGIAGNSGTFDNPSEEKVSPSIVDLFVTSAYAQEADEPADTDELISEIIANYDCEEAQAIAVEVAEVFEDMPASGSDANSWVSWVTGLAAVIGGAVTYIVQLIVRRKSKAAAG